MAERCYSESVLRLHGRIIAVPLSMACGMAMGLFTQVEPFRSNLLLYVIGLFTVLGLTCMYFALDARGLTPVLRVGSESLAFDVGGRIKLDWQDIKNISCEVIPNPGTETGGEPRVVIEARKAGEIGAASQRYVLDHTYGLSAQDLCARLKAHHLGRQPAMIATAASERAVRAAYRKTVEERESETHIVFGRRASDRMGRRR